ncbi:MAG TPA: methyltransferase domain-containing protein [Afifellaceae bacterium]|nr:methyltransferase domain-containing protein [Afifellaceae bacterium]
MVAHMLGRSRESTVKALIRRRYADSAARALHGSDGHRRALRAGYSAQMLAHAPPRLIDAWSGCGNLAEYVMLEGSETVVDLGCGSGLDAWLIATAPHAPKHVIALDLTPQTLAGLHDARAGATPCELHPIAGDMEQLPLADACCDLIIANAAFNLALDPRKALAEAARILRPGGRLHAMDLVRETALPAELLADPMGHGASLGGVMHERDLHAAVSAAGFVDVAIHGHRPFQPVIAVQIEARLPAPLLASQQSDDRAQPADDRPECSMNDHRRHPGAGISLAAENPFPQEQRYEQALRSDQQNPAE